MRTFHFPGSSLASVECSINWGRWNCGNEPGRWHIFSVGLPLQFLISAQAVVDDFGNLVVVSP